VSDHKKIAVNYLKSWFLPDFATVIPFYLFDLPEVGYFVRMIRLVKIPNALNMIDGRGVSVLLLKLTQGASRN
jgi:hypothetical protein